MPLEELQKHPEMYHFNEDGTWRFTSLEERKDLYIKELKREIENLNNDHATINAERIECRDIRKAWIEVDGKRQKLRKALIGLVGAESKEDLEKMKVFINSMGVPFNDQTAINNAIDALLETI